MEASKALLAVAVTSSKLVPLLWWLEQAHGFHQVGLGLSQTPVQAGPVDNPFVLIQN